MLRQELQSYFNRVYPRAKIDTEHSIGGPVYIRFELGGKLKNGSSKRVHQSVERAMKIFFDVFEDPTTDIFVLIYEYDSGNILNTSNEYLRNQFPIDACTDFYDQLEMVNTRFFITDENGNDVIEKTEARVIIGKLQVKNINIKNILTGIANTEMGFEPSIDQLVFFFDPSTDRAFQMYDDRGCYVWSNKAENIRDIYIKRNNWIVDYDRKEIDQYF